eukprot:IDg16081t1
MLNDRFLRIGAAIARLADGENALLKILAVEMSTKARIQIEKLNDNNFHFWRQKIVPVFRHRKVEDIIDVCLRTEKPKDGLE